MQTKDFKGQDLRGRSFKNQDLTGADFSDCDLRGVDFSFANLIDARFCNAKMGRTLIDEFILFSFQIILGFIAGIAALCSIFSSLVMVDIFSSDSASDISYIIFTLSYTVLFINIVLLEINKIKFNYLLLILGFIAIAILTAILQIPQSTLTNFINKLFEFFEFIVGGISTALAAIFIVSISEYIVGFSALVIITYSIIRSINLSLITFLVGFSISSAFILLGVYIGWRSHKREESHLLLIHKLALKISCYGGTQFKLANLNRANFSNADLKHANFTKAKISNCYFRQAKNHHLALTENSSLELRKVRDLVIDGIITDKNFAILDLRGLDFSNLNLQDFDFSHANLSGANLSHTQLTGATLEGWSIDTETRLDDIDCRYFYYLENGAKQRMPPKGEEYGAGEFTRIFQKIANTIDFIAHNEIELAAIKLSVEQVRVESGNDDIRVQAIEEKDGFIIVKVNIPKTEDKGILYHEVNSLKQEYESKIQLLMSEKNNQISKIEVLKEQLKEQRDDFLGEIKKRNLLVLNNINHIRGEIESESEKLIKELEEKKNLQLSTLSDFGQKESHSEE